MGRDKLATAPKPPPIFIHITPSEPRPRRHSYRDMLHVLTAEPPKFEMSVEGVPYAQHELTPADAVQIVRGLGVVARHLAFEAIRGAVDAFLEEPEAKPKKRKPRRRAK